MRRRETGLISGRPKLVDAMETGINIEERRRNAAGNVGTTDGDDQQVLRAAGKTVGIVFPRFRRFCSLATRGGRVSLACERFVDGFLEILEIVGCRGMGDASSTSFHTAIAV